MLVVGLTLLAAVIRLVRLGTESFWIDEVSEARTASLIATQGWRAIASRDNVSPLSHVVLAGVQHVFGRSEVAARVPGALAGVVLVPVAYALGRRLFGTRVGLIAAALVAVSPYAVWYARDARMYSYLALISALYLWCFIGFVAHATRRNAIGLVLLGIAGLYVHEYFVFVMAASSGWAAWCWFRSDRARLMRLVMMNAVSVIGFVPWMIAISGYDAGTAGSQRSGVVFFAPYTLISYFIGFTIGPSIREMQQVGAMAAMRDHAVAIAAPLLVVASTAGVVWLAFRNARRDHDPEPGLRFLGVIVASMIVLPVLAGSVTDTVNFNVRYCAGAVVPLMIVVAVAFDRLRRRSLAALGLGALVTVMGVSTFGVVWPGDRYAREDIRALSHHLQRSTPKGPVFVESPTIVEGLRWYGYHGPLVAVRDPNAPDVVAQYRARERSGDDVTLVQAREWEFDGGDVLARRLERAGFRVTRAHSAPGARIRTYSYAGPHPRP